MTFRKISLNLLVAGTLMLTVASCGPKDTEIKANVESAIASPAVMVSVDKGVATLSGEVANEADKAALEAKAKSVKGVKSVSNNITVAPPPPPPPPAVSDDATITKAVNDAIKDVPSVKASIVGGVVTLTGTATREQSIKVLQGVNGAGVKQVVNQITIK